MCSSVYQAARSSSLPSGTDMATAKITGAGRPAGDPSSLTCS